MFDPLAALDPAGPSGPFSHRGKLPDSFPTGGFWTPPHPPTILDLRDITRKVPCMGNIPYAVLILSGIVYFLS